MHNKRVNTIGFVKNTVKRTQSLHMWTYMYSAEYKFLKNLRFLY